MTERFSEFLRKAVGPNWVLAKRTKRIIEKYGEDVACLSPSSYESLVYAYEKKTGLAAHGLDGEPCDRLKMSALDLYLALRDLVNLHAGLHVPDVVRTARDLVDRLDINHASTERPSPAGRALPASPLGCKASR